MSEWIYIDNAGEPNCGTGAGGFQEGNNCAKRKKRSTEKERVEKRREKAAIASQKVAEAQIPNPVDFEVKNFSQQNRLDRYNEWLEGGNKYREEALVLSDRAMEAEEGKAVDLHAAAAYAFSKAFTQYSQAQYSLSGYYSDNYTDVRNREELLLNLVDLAGKAEQSHLYAYARLRKLPAPGGNTSIEYYVDRKGNIWQNSDLPPYEHKIGKVPDSLAVNVFCPTGEGGGVDPTCSPKGKSPIPSELANLREEIADEIQSIYDAWNPEYCSTGDILHGKGGICGGIAETVLGFVTDYVKELEGVERVSVGEHEYVLAKIKGKVYSIDIPYEKYETRLGYHQWEKKPSVKFKLEDVEIKEVDPSDLGGVESLPFPPYLELKKRGFSGFLDKRVDNEWIYIDNADEPNCGTGAGGFQPGNTCASGGGRKLPTPPKVKSPLGDPSRYKWEGKASVLLGEATTEHEAEVVTKRLLGRGAYLEDLSRLVGVPDDGAIEVVADTDKDRIEIAVWHPTYSADRRIRRLWNNELVIDNQGFFMEDQYQGQGLGTEIFRNQVEAAEAMGIAQIWTHAAKENPNEPEKPHNGYYTWPLMGYNQSIASIELESPKVGKELRKKFPRANDILDVMETEAGQKWWYENGTDLYSAVFTIKPNKDGSPSRSMRVLENYLDRKRRQRAAKKLAGNAEKENCGTGDGGFKRGNTCASGAREPLFGASLPGRARRYSWMDPNGNITPVEATHDHASMASKILDREDYIEAYDELLRKGWQRLAFVGSLQYTNNPLQPPNHKQLKALKDMAIEEGAGVLVYDNDKGDPKTLWSREDEGTNNAFLTENIEDAMEERERRDTGGIERTDFTEEEIAEMEEALLELGRAKRGEDGWENLEPTENVFCPTGEGGGVDPSCKKREPTQLFRSTKKPLTSRVGELIPHEEVRGALQTSRVLSDETKNWMESEESDEVLGGAGTIGGNNERRRLRGFIKSLNTDLEEVQRLKGSSPETLADAHSWASYSHELLARHLQTNFPQMRDLAEEHMTAANMHLDAEEALLGHPVRGQLGRDERAKRYKSSVTENASYFSRCPRDSRGWCESSGEGGGGGGSSEAKWEPTEKAVNTTLEALSRKRPETLSKQQFDDGGYRNGAINKINGVLEELTVLIDEIQDEPDPAKRADLHVAAAALARVGHDWHYALRLTPQFISGEEKERAWMEEFNREHERLGFGFSNVMRDHLDAWAKLTGRSPSVSYYVTSYGRITQPGGGEVYRLPPDKIIRVNSSYFSRCPRNDRGWCESSGEGGGGGSGRTEVSKAREAAAEASQQVAKFRRLPSFKGREQYNSHIAKAERLRDEALVMSDRAQEENDPERASLLHAAAARLFYNSRFDYYDATLRAEEYLPRTPLRSKERRLVREAITSLRGYILEQLEEAKKAHEEAYARLKGIDPSQEVWARDSGWISQVERGSIHPGEIIERLPDDLIINQDWTYLSNADEPNCGTGAGGFKRGNTCASGGRGTEWSTNEDLIRAIGFTGYTEVLRTTVPESNAKTYGVVQGHRAREVLATLRAGLKKNGLKAISEEYVSFSPHYDRWSELYLHPEGHTVLVRFSEGTHGPLADDLRFWVKWVPPTLREGVSITEGANETSYKAGVRNTVERTYPLGIRHNWIVQARGYAQEGDHEKAVWAHEQLANYHEGASEAAHDDEWRFEHRDAYAAHKIASDYHKERSGTLNEDCGTGKGGFKKGNTCAKGTGWVDLESSPDFVGPPRPPKSSALVSRLKKLGVDLSRETASRQLGQIKELKEKIGTDVHYLEHAAKEWVKDKYESILIHAPEPIAEGVKATLALTRFGTKVAFGTWLAASALAKRTAEKLGLSKEEAEKLRDKLFEKDILAAKPAQLAASALAGGVGAGIASLVPPATAGYLAKNLTLHPIATSNAAKELVLETIEKSSEGVSRALGEEYKGGTAEKPKYASIKVEKLAGNASYFSRCPRDGRGWCMASDEGGGGGGGASTHHGDYRPEEAAVRQSLAVSISSLASLPRPRTVKARSASGESWNTSVSEGNRLLARSLVLADQASDEPRPTYAADMYGAVAQLMRQAHREYHNLLYEPRYSKNRQTKLELQQLISSLQNNINETLQTYAYLRGASREIQYQINPDSGSIYHLVGSPIRPGIARVWSNVEIGQVPHNLVYNSKFNQDLFKFRAFNEWLSKQDVLTLSTNAGEGENCGTGKGGFKRGNTCASEEDGKPPAGSTPTPISRGNFSLGNWLKSKLGAPHYGNYCGPGNKLKRGSCKTLEDGSPMPRALNPVDAACRRHDKEYCEAGADWKAGIIGFSRSTPETRAADRRLIERLEKIQPYLKSKRQRVASKAIGSYFKIKSHLDKKRYGDGEVATNEWTFLGNASEGENCGTGKGGFKKGNKCARGRGRQVSTEQVLAKTLRDDPGDELTAAALADYYEERGETQKAHIIRAGAIAERRGRVRFEYKDKQGGTSRLVVKKLTGEWISQHFYQDPGEEGFTLSEEYQLDYSGNMPGQQAVEEALGVFGKVDRVVTNAEGGENCGAGSPGDKGFQPGNTCASGSGGSQPSRPRRGDTWKGRGEALGAKVEEIANAAFPGTDITRHYAFTTVISHDANRQINFYPDEVKGAIDVDFSTLTGDYDEVGETLKKGTIELAHRFRAFLERARDAGIPIIYAASGEFKGDRRRANLYNRIMTAVGYEEYDDDDLIQGHIWYPKGTTPPPGVRRRK